MKFAKKFRDDLSEVMRALTEREKFCFIRFADGEKMLLDRASGVNADRWKSPGARWVRDGLDEALACRLAGVYFGISCPSCDRQSNQAYMARLVDVPEERVTFSDIFVNANWTRWANFCGAEGHPLYVTVGSGMCDYVVPENVVNDERYDVEQLVDKLMDETRPIFMAAGPLGKVAAVRYWKRAVAGLIERPQSIVDIGSSLDPWIHAGAATRGYHKKGSETRGKICWWRDEDRPTANPGPMDHTVKGFS